MREGDFRSPSGLIERYINTAYDDIRAIARIIPELLELLEYFRNYEKEADKNFEFTQSTPSTVWTIVHNMEKNPSVTYLQDIEGDINFIDTNKLEIVFSEPVSGSVVLN